MAQRRYGPTRGAGVVTIEKEGDKTIEPGALGWVGYPGILEKGPVGELIECQNKATFFKKCGSYIDDSLLPDSAYSYYRLANGAGGIFLIRITDGNEAQAQIPLYARMGAVLTPMGTLKAHNGGRWGGKEARYSGDVVAVADIEETQITTGVTTWKTDQWAGGYVELEGVANKQYPIVGNTAAGVITVASDQTMDTDLDDGTETRYYLVLENDNKAVSFLLGDGEEKPDSEFSLEVYIDGDFIKKYPNLSTDPVSGNYWVSVINNDDGNDEIFAVDLWTGAHTASVRPANHYGKIEAVTETVLTAEISDFAISSVGGGDPTLVLGTTDDEMVSQKITVTMTSATEGTVASDVFGSFTPTVTLGTEYTDNKFTPPFTITAGTNPLDVDDTLVINYKPFKLDSLIGGHLYPDKPNSKLEKYRIVDNNHNTITVAAGSDLTGSGEVGDEFLVEAAIEMQGGIDGNADITDSSYTQQAWDTSSSPFNRIFGRNMGLVKMATPGVTATAVIKAGAAYAEAKNHQYRYEIIDSIVTESGAVTAINSTLGRNDFGVCSFPSYAYVSDPLATGSGKRKLVSATGMIHGREARIAVDYDGYHKAEAGVNATLPEILALPTGEKSLNEEILNPLGVSIIKKVKGNYVIWGDRTLYIDPGWKWKHQREQMSYYEHVLMENFDWIIFAINDTEMWSLARTALITFFSAEWRPKRALRGDTFEEAAIIKIDSENNTNATMAAGDLNAAVSLRLADTIERFIITIGKQGIFDSAG
jgi:hypothetical protein